MAQVTAKHGESIDTLWRRFRKAVEKEGIVKLAKERGGKFGDPFGGYRSPGEKRRLKHSVAVKRQRKDLAKREGLADLVR